MGTLDENGDIVFDRTSVLKRCQTDFKNLFNKAKACEGPNFDEQFYNDVKKFKTDLEEH